MTKYPHDKVSSSLRHGPDRGFLISDVVSMLSAGLMNPFVNNLVLDVVYWIVPKLQYLLAALGSLS